MQDLAHWLEELGMSEYAQRFAENGIDASALRYLTDQDLEKIGVLLGHRRKILAAIAELVGGPQMPSRPTPTHAKVQDTAERRQVTVMLSDLVGSTALSARMDPEDLREVISAYQKCVANTVQRLGGFVAKYMGDGVLAYFGYPQAHEDDPERAVRAGLELIAAVSSLQTASPLQTRVGIATGLVVVGDLVGSGEAQERGIVGETPNLAARLQGIAEPNTVVIAESTRRLLGNLFELEDLGARDLKGIAEPSRTWAVLRPSAVESRFEALRTATTPLIGREEEIELLMRRWTQAKAGDGCVVLISGEPGIGKSRIVQAMQERLGVESHTRLRFFCSPHHQDSALYPAIAQLERAAGFRRDDTAKQRLDKLEAVLLQATNDISEIVPLLADLLSIPIVSRYAASDLTPQKRKEKTLAALVAQAEGLSLRVPVLMVFEDVHWSDPTTRESLDLLVDRVSAIRALVIITFRPEFMPPWIGRPHVTLMSLSRLSRQQRADMITGVIGGATLPKEIAEQIIDRTDGVPLFIEELTKSVVESGLVTKAGDHYSVAGPTAPLAIPTTLQASLLARLDRLAPTREVAQIGAALGRSFSHEVISAVARMPQKQMDGTLEQLVNAELIFRRGTPPEAEYTFKHALVQDAAYSTLLRSRRQQIHARVASTLENQFPEVMIAQPELLAHHCGEAGLNEKAIDYWLRAGQQAATRSAMIEAVAQLRKGLEVLARLPDTVQRQQLELNLQVTIIPALIATRGYAAAEVGATIATARALAEQLDRPDYLARLLYAQWVFRFVRAEHQLALAHAQELENLGETRADPIVLSLGRIYHGNTRFNLGQFTEARALYEQCHVVFDPAHRSAYTGMTAEEPRHVVQVYSAATSMYLGLLDQGRELINEALADAHQLGHIHSLVFTLGHVCWVEWAAGVASDAQQHSAELVTLATEHDFPLWLGWGIVHRGWSLVALGKPEEGLRSLAEGLSVQSATGGITWVPWSMTLLAEAHVKLNQITDAQTCLTEAERLIAKTDERYSEAELHRVRGDVLNATSDSGLAEESYRQAITVARHQRAKTLELRAATSLACLKHKQGKFSEARDVLAPVYGWFKQGHDTPVLKDAKALLEQLAS